MFGEIGYVHTVIVLMVSHPCTHVKNGQTSSLKIIVPFIVCQLCLNKVPNKMRYDKNLRNEFLLDLD